MSRLESFKLIDEDFGGYRPEDIRCRSCSCLCSTKTVRLYRGEQLPICLQLPAARTVLGNEKSRRR